MLVLHDYLEIYPYGLIDYDKYDNDDEFMDALDALIFSLEAIYEDYMPYFPHVVNTTSMYTGRKYQILRKGADGNMELTEAQCSNSTRSGFHPSEQDFSNEIMHEIEIACEYFHVRPIPDYFGVPEIEGISDEEVIRRVKNFDDNENEKEAGGYHDYMSKRTHGKFPVSELPLERQRALIERIEVIKNRWEFKWLE